MSVFDKPKPTDPRVQKGDAGFTGPSAGVAGSIPLRSILPRIGRPGAGDQSVLKSEYSDIRQELLAVPWGRQGGREKRRAPAPARSWGGGYGAPYLSGMIVGFTLGRFTSATPWFRNLSPTVRFASGVGMSLAGTTMGVVGEGSRSPFLTGLGLGFGWSGTITWAEGAYDVAVEAGRASWEAFREGVQVAGDYVASGIRGAEQFGSPPALEFATELYRRGRAGMHRWLSWH